MLNRAHMFGSYDFCISITIHFTGSELHVSFKGAWLVSHESHFSHTYPMSCWVPRQTTAHHKAWPAEWVWSEVI
jgi:hypothetical protein